MKKVIGIASFVLLTACLPLYSVEVLIEAERFAQYGGWVLDQQFMDEMGSPFLLAHGLGIPVAHATTTVCFDQSGTYRVWVRTRDWVGPWKTAQTPPAKRAQGTPGRFQLAVQGKVLGAVFGTQGAQWHWQDGGTIKITDSEVSLALQDLTGFEGRCDALFFTSNLNAVPPEDPQVLERWRRRLSGLSAEPKDLGPFDLVVVGGGLGGMCASLQGARQGLKVALVQDRPVLGGNNSGEVRVWLNGGVNYPPYPRVGDIVQELEPARRAHYGPSNTAALYEDQQRIALFEKEPNLALFLNCRVDQVEMDNNTITAVIGEDIKTGQRLRFTGAFFADCTGDGCVGFLAGADYDMTMDGHMGRCNLWNIKDVGQPTTFPRCPWALDLHDKPFPTRERDLGAWFWESGFYRDPINEGETIRDWNFRAMYGAWDALKNTHQRYPQHRLNWAAYVSGKRESRRLLGDVILTQEDLTQGLRYVDGMVPSTWKIDLHLPNPAYQPGFEGDEFISKAFYTDYKPPYWIPYRCLYSRNINNLFMAGRDISVTHQALGAVRVMRTGGMMGEVVGMATALCRQYHCTPRGLFQNYLDELKQALGYVAPSPPPAWLGNPGRNLALQAGVAVSSTYRDNYKPAYLNDGRADTRDNDARWLSRASTDPHSVTFTWARPVEVNAACIVSGWSSGGTASDPIADFHIEKKTPSGWQAVAGSAVTGNRDTEWAGTFSPTQAHSLRLVITRTRSNIARVWEVELYRVPEPTVQESMAQFSGIYPHLAHFNQHNECGTGAVVPWADRLWVITYSPHYPKGSTDKLYEIDAQRQRIIRPESVGGTHANRFIHQESQQLFIGSHVIDAQGKVRTISPQTMSGRLTGNARHLTDPQNKIYYATMEEGFYEVDVQSLAVKELYRDGNLTKHKAGVLLPGYHGKGLYSGQGRLIYANNGESSRAARQRPDVPSGVLATWDGQDWSVVRRNQFCEVMGPGGLTGNTNPQTDPVWSIGWDHRSLLLMLLDRGQWHCYRLPKASHCYDGAHGWNTEWPRIRDIGAGDDWLMTMHGMFWRFPRGFRRTQSAGIGPRSTYLKVIGDFCRWNERLVFGCDDSARAEFLNTRKAKGKLAGPSQSQSNLWFVKPEQIDHLGPARGRGGVWVQDPVSAGVPSDPFLWQGFRHRSLHLAHQSEEPVTFSLQVDRRGNGTWAHLQDVTVPARGARWLSWEEGDKGVWLRLLADRNCQATAWFEFTQPDDRPTRPCTRFGGLAPLGNTDIRGGLVHAGTEQVGLQVLATRIQDDVETCTGYYSMGPDMQLRPDGSPEKRDWMQKNVAIPQEILQVDRASVLYIDDQGKRYRLPVGNPLYWRAGSHHRRIRIAREVCTERDLFQAAGVFYELPARNAGGFAKIRPVATHLYRIQDYCSWRGLLVLTGIKPELVSPKRHIIQSADGQCAVWVGAVDDLWHLGKVRGQGGPWKDTAVEAHEPSDPYLLAGFDQKTLHLSHQSHSVLSITAEIDITGEGHWLTYKTWTVQPGQTLEYGFPPGFNAYWIRFHADKDSVATAWLDYR